MPFRALVAFGDFFDFAQQVGEADLATLGRNDVVGGEEVAESAIPLTQSKIAQLNQQALEAFAKKLDEHFRAAAGIDQVTGRGFCESDVGLVKHQSQ